MCKVDIRYSVQRNCLNDSSLKINGCNVELQGVISKFLIPSIQINHLLMQKKKKTLYLRVRSTALVFIPRRLIIAQKCDWENLFFIIRIRNCTCSIERFFFNVSKNVHSARVGWVSRWRSNPPPIIISSLACALLYI